MADHAEKIARSVAAIAGAVANGGGYDALIEQHASLLRAAFPSPALPSTRLRLRGLLACALEEEREARQVAARQEASGDGLREAARRAYTYLLKSDDFRSDLEDLAIADALSAALVAAPSVAAPPGESPSVAQFQVHREPGDPFDTWTVAYADGESFLDGLDKETAERVGAAMNGDGAAYERILEARDREIARLGEEVDRLRAAPPGEGASDSVATGEIPELLPCPFCDGPAELIVGPIKDRWGSRCAECDVWRDDRCARPEDAAVAWNQRYYVAAAPPPAMSEESGNGRPGDHLPTIKRHADGGFVWTNCKSCGPDVKVDEDGCCLSCGRDALEYGNEESAPSALSVEPEAEDVLAVASVHANRWKSQPDAYWFQRLTAEVGELGGSLAGDHPDPPEHELRQIGSIAINWLRHRAALAPERKAEGGAEGGEVRP